MKKISLELGGNAPTIVFDDADLELAVETAVSGKSRNSGQTCVCTNRFYVQDGIYDEFARRLTERVRKLKVGNGFDEGVEQGPLINLSAVKKVESHVEDAKSKGGRVLLGGKRHALGATFYEPTAIADAKPVPAFLSAHPDIQLEVAFSDSRIDLIETRTDLAIRIGSLADSSLKAKRLAPHQRLLCAAPSVMSKQSSLELPSDLASVQCLPMATSERWYYRVALGDAAEGSSLPSQSVAVSGRLCSSDLQALRVAVAGGLGVALLPSWLVGDDIAAGRLLRLLPSWDLSVTDDFDQAVWALYPPKKIVSPKVRAFLDHMHERLSISLAEPLSNIDLPHRSHPRTRK